MAVLLAVFVILVSFFILVMRNYHWLGVQEVAGSNPVTPTNLKLSKLLRFLLWKQGLKPPLISAHKCSKRRANEWVAGGKIGGTPELKNTTFKVNQIQSESTYFLILQHLFHRTKHISTLGPRTALGGFIYGKTIH